MWNIGGMMKPGRGIRTRFSDDLLWLAYITEEYINFTGDYTILDIKTNYIEGADLEEGTDEKYDKYLPSKESLVQLETKVKEKVYG